MMPRDRIYEKIPSQSAFVLGEKMVTHIKSLTRQSAKANAEERGCNFVHRSVSRSAHAQLWRCSLCIAILLPTCGISAQLLSVRSRSQITRLPTWADNV